MPSRRAPLHRWATLLGHLALVALAAPAPGCADEAPVPRPSPIPPTRMQREDAQREAAAAADGAPTAAALALAEADMAAGIDALDAIDAPDARAYAAFFRLMTPALPPAEAAAAAARLLHELDGTATTGTIDRGPPLRAGQAALALRFVLEVHGTGAIPCWIAARFPDAWFEGFGAYYGSSRDGIGQGCAPALDPAWSAQIEAALRQAAGPQTGGCGTMHIGHAAALSAALHRLEVQPRHAADAGDAVAVHQKTVADFCARARVEPAACAALAAALAPPAAWVATAERAAQQQGLSADEARRAVANTALAVQTLRVEIEGTCAHDRQGLPSEP